MDILSLIAIIVKYVREYLSEGWDGRGFVEPLEEDDGMNYVGGEACEVDGRLNDITETNECLQENNQVVNIHIHDNQGTDIIDDRLSLLFPQLESPQYPEPESAETAAINELDENWQDGNSKISCPEFPRLPKNKQKETMRGKKKRVRDEIIIKQKIPSLSKRIQLIQENLSENRGEGEWKKHDETIERLMKEYEHDDDNYDIMLLLNYEKAVGLYQRNYTKNASELLKKVDRKIGRDVLSSTNETQKMIYVRCLLLASDISCQRKRFGKAKKALNKVHDFLVSSNSALLKTEFHLAQAQYLLKQVEQQSNNSLYSCIENVINETKKAERVADTIKSDNTKIWTTLRMDILLKRANAILKLSDHEEYAETLKDSLEEINHTLYDKSLEINKVKYRYLMCCYYKRLGNLEQAVEQAKVGLEIAEKCGFPVEKKQLIEKIEEIENSPGFKNLSCKDSAEVIHDILHLNTTDTGNVESNAVAQSCGDIFSDTDAFSDDDDDDDDEEYVQKFESIEEDESKEVLEYFCDTHLARPRSLEQIVGNSSYQDLVAGGEGADLHAGKVDVPGDYMKLTEGEQMILATQLGSCWMDVHEKKEEILRDVNRYPNINSRAKEVLHIYNEQKEFSRKNLAKLIEQDLQLHEEAEHITSGRYKIPEENKESKTFESVRGTECALDDLHGTHAVPKDNVKLTEREQTRLAKHLNPHWNLLSGLLDIDDDIRRNILTNVYYYPDNISKAKEILHIYNKRPEDFSRKNLAKLVERDLKLPEEADAIINGTYQSI